MCFNNQSRAYKTFVPKSLRDALHQLSANIYLRALMQFVGTARLNQVGEALEACKDTAIWNLISCTEGIVWGKECPSQIVGHSCQQIDHALVGTSSPLQCLNLLFLHEGLPLRIVLECNLWGRVGLVSAKKRDAFGLHWCVD